MSEPKLITVTLQQNRDYQFRVSFAPAPPVELVTDEAPPLGGNAGPNPAQLLTAAVANCLAASLQFSLRKFHNNPEPITASAVAHIARNAQNRLRVARMDVEIRLGKPVADLRNSERAVAQFEDFCVVTQSVREGFEVGVTVLDSDGTALMTDVAD